MGIFELQAGDFVVYRKQKYSPSPGKRAKGIVAASNGDEYTYFVDKYWVVEGIEPDGSIRLLTRTGKSHTVDQADSNLRRANWLEKLLLSYRFPRSGSDESKTG